MQIASTGSTLRCTVPAQNSDTTSGWQVKVQAEYNSIRSGGLSDRASISEAMIEQQMRSGARDQVILELTQIGIDRQTAEKALPNVIPVEARILENVRTARGLSASDYIDRVRPHGSWDYKRDSHPENEDFGNFNFGVTTRAWANIFFSDGIPSAWDKYLEDFVLRGAGFVQEFVTHTSQDDWGWFLGSPPYGDDPRDQGQIKAGWEMDKEIESPETDTSDGDAELN